MWHHCCRRHIVFTHIRPSAHLKTPTMDWVLHDGAGADCASGVAQELHCRRNLTPPPVPM
jgi:hypothetical protein